MVTLRITLFQPRISWNNDSLMSCFIYLILQNYTHMRRDSKSSKLFFTSHVTFCVIVSDLLLLLPLFSYRYFISVTMLQKLQLPIQCQNSSVYLLVYPAQFFSHYTLKGRNCFTVTLMLLITKGNDLAKQEQDAIK